MEFKRKRNFIVSPKKGKTYEEMYGLKKAARLRAKHSNVMRGKSHPSHRKGKTFEELYGEKDAKKYKANMSLACSKKPQRPEEMRKKMNQEKKGKTYEELYGEEFALQYKNKLSNSIGEKFSSPEGRKSRRMAAVAYKEKYGIIGKIIGKQEQIILNDLETRHSIKIIRQYPVIGYWLDGYCKETNIAYEIDEEHHFNKDGTYKEKDIRRQKEIEQELGCKFVRIKVE